MWLFYMYVLAKGKKYKNFTVPFYHSLAIYHACLNEMLLGNVYNVCLMLYFD